MELEYLNEYEENVLSKIIIPIHSDNNNRNMLIFFEKTIIDYR